MYFILQRIYFKLFKKDPNPKFNPTKTKRVQSEENHGKNARVFDYLRPCFSFRINRLTLPCFKKRNLLKCDADRILLEDLILKVVFVFVVINPSCLVLYPKSQLTIILFTEQSKKG